MEMNTRVLFVPDGKKMEALARLSGRVAHDINNVLGAIEGYATLTASAFKDGDQVKEDMHEIRRAVTSAAGIMRQLLAFSQKTLLKKEACDLKPLLSSLPGRVPAVENIKISLSIAEGLPPVLADAACLERVFLNLLENSREAMPSGGAIAIRAESAAGRAGFVRVSVEDSGPGMTPEIMDRLFEPFFTTRGKGKGSGLGLAYVYGSALQHGGGVEARSAPGLGSELSVFLPVRPT
jgi:two-component system cell cycle sensor histidine kinase/response regulator CckA